MTKPADPPKASENSHRARLTLRIRVFGKGEHWYAESIDLSLIARRGDPDEALGALLEQVALYLEDASDSNQWDKMVPRPASFRRQFWYYFAAWMDLARRLIGHSLEASTYKIPTDRRGHLVGGRG